LAVSVQAEDLEAHWAALLKLLAIAPQRATLAVSAIFSIYIRFGLAAIGATAANSVPTH
jgi:hypothetical protein